MSCQYYKYNRFFFNFLVFVATLFCCSFLFVHKTKAGETKHLLAYSKKHDVEILADAPNEKWCSKAIILRIYAKNKPFFFSSNYRKLMQRLGKIINKQCNKALAISVYGYEKQDKKLVYQATAEKSANWALNVKQMTKKQKKKTFEDKDTIYTSFSVNGWQPPKLGEDIKIIGDDVYEHIIKTEDDKCAIKYGRKKNKKEMKNWHITVQGNPCHNYFLSGKASIQVINDKGKIDGEGTGYFTDGYFTLEQRWDVLLMNRYAFGKEHQIINFLIDSDPKLKIHYVGYLRSDYKEKYKKYTKWHGCDPFIVNAVTENKAVFLDDELTKKVIKKSIEQADFFCPKATKISLFGTSKPNDVKGLDKPTKNKNYDFMKNKDLLFNISINKKNKVWNYSLDRANNPTKIRNLLSLAQKRKKWKIIQKDYLMLKNKSFKERLAYLANQNKIDNYQNIYTTSLVTDKKIKTTLLVNIKNKNNNGFYSTDFPKNLILSSRNAELKKGWHLITGELKAFRNLSVKNFYANSKLFVESAIKCKKQRCFDANNLVKLVRQRYNDNNWAPNNMP